jgi:lyso-ornithine lipid O-acyltransferase
MFALKHKINVVLASFKALLFLLLVAVLILPQLIFSQIKTPYNLILPRFFHWCLLKILNIKVTICGESKHALLISNHLSWLDIVVLGSIKPLRFVSKKEVESWFLFGFLAKLQQTIFVDRDNRNAIISSKKSLEKALVTSPVVLFAEGTTSNGSCVLSFNSSFIVSPAQAVCISYKNYEPIAWYGDMTLPPHLWQVFKMRKIDVTIDFLDSFQEGNRKFIAESVELTVRAKYHERLSVSK